MIVLTARLTYEKTITSLSITKEGDVYHLFVTVNGRTTSTATFGNEELAKRKFVEIIKKQVL